MTGSIFHVRRVIHAAVILGALLTNSLTVEGQEHPTGESVLARLNASIDANRSAAKSVVLHGRITSQGVVIKPGSGKPERGPYRAAGTYVYTADEFGRYRRLDIDWQQNPLTNELQSRRALADNVTLRVDSPSAGYLSRGEDFLPAAEWDFYRDHWLGLPLNKITGKQQPLEGWTVQNLTEGILQLEYKLNYDGKELRHLIEVNPGWDYLIKRVLDMGEFNEHQCEWKKDSGAQVWYPQKTVSRHRSIYPSGMVWEEVIVKETSGAQFNETIPAQSFTFGGLGLQTGAMVGDQRMSATTELMYLPSADRVEKIAHDLVPLAVGQAIQERHALRRRWLIGLAVAGTVLALGVFLGYRFTQARRKQMATG
jgi:hypothetical protein